ncbi:hypothetical protein KR074_012598, partial [Drosophila pseudoananassae]
MEPVSEPVKNVDYSMGCQEKAIVENINADQDAIKRMNSLDDLSLQLEKKAEEKFNITQDEVVLRNYLAVGVQWVSLVTENLLSHPFIVLRRQCQVFSTSKRYHIHPITLLPSILNLQRQQGVATLWKGVGSCLMVRGMTLAIDDVICKFTGWPKKVNSKSTLKRFGQHILLKCFSIGVVVPFYCASLVETVQSDIASEKPGLFDVFREGSLRFLHWSSPQKGRMLPAWALIGPCVSLGIIKYSFSLVIRGLSSRIMRRRLTVLRKKRAEKISDDVLDNQDAEVYANLITTITTEVIFYPFETVLHRLQLQGTRTIIDNLDNGSAVVPILTNYQGAIDCYQSTIFSEGFCGLYKGIGAMILQFVSHLAVLKLSKWIVRKISETLSSRPSSRVVHYYNIDNIVCRSTHSNTTPSIAS